MQAELLTIDVNGKVEIIVIKIIWIVKSEIRIYLISLNLRFLLHKKATLKNYHNNHNI